MKNLLFLLTTFGLGMMSQAQTVWETLPANTNVNSTIYDIEMVDGRVFQIYYQNTAGTDEVFVDMYNPKTLAWQNLSIMPSSVISRLKTEQINGTILVATYDNNNNFSFFKLDQGTTSLANAAPNYSEVGVNDNWEFHTGKNAGEMYVLYTTGSGPSDVHGLEFDFSGGTWTHMSETVSSNLTNATLRIQSSTTDVYFGVYSTKIRMTRFVKGAIGTMFAYDGGPTGEILSSGSVWNNNGYAIIGNKTDLPFFFGTENVNNKSYEAVIDGTTIDISLTQPSAGYSLDTFNIAVESSPSHSFIFSNFGNEGLGNPHERVSVIRRDLTLPGDPWTDLGTPLLPLGTALEANSLRMGIDNGNLHLAASYTQFGASSNEIKVANQQPYLLAGSADPNTGLCPNQINEIYSNLYIMDEDYDMVKILSATSVNSFTSGITVIPNGHDSGVSKFKIFGMPTASSDQISIQYTDGYNTYSTLLNVYIGNTNPINLQFISDPVLLCSNEKQVDLSQKVNYYDGGFFRLNGQELSGTTIDATNLTPSAGNLRYTVSVNGCFISATANYTVVTAPLLSVSTIPTSCSGNLGEASVVLTPGSSGNTFLYWSTGEQTTTITNLIPGAYYVHVNDDNGCHSTALASVETSDITVSETVVNPTCSDSKNGSISLVVGGTSTYQIVWSNGTFGEVADKLKPGNYEFTLYDASGCEVKRSYILTSPAALKNTFTVSKPDCGASNGGLISNVTGGTSPYQYAWSTGGTNPNLTAISRGFYSLTVTDDAGCILKDSITLNEKLAIEIKDSVILADCNKNNGGIDVTLTQSGLGDPLASVQWDNGLTTEDIYNLAAGTYTIYALTTSNCASQKTITVGTKRPLANEICVVTVDDATTTNLIVWEKAEMEGISFYNIYRENAQAGNYMWIDTVQYSSLSVFNDVIASPLQRSWRYRISAVNECGVEGPISAPHKTLHLNTINQSTPGVVDIYWDDYEGTTAAEYVVNRFTDQNGWEVLSPTVPFGNPTVFTDTPPTGSTSLDYYVSLNLTDPCTATYKAQDFNSSRSNKEKGIFNPGSGTGNSSNAGISVLEDQVFLSVSPNPFNEVLNIKLLGASKTTVEIRDIHGKLIRSSICKEGESVIPTENLSSGVYFVSAQLKGSLRTMKIVK